MGQVDEIAIVRAWHRYVGNYPVVEALGRWLRMSPRQRAEVLKKLKEAGRLPKESEE